MSDHISSLFKLQVLDFNESKDSNSEAARTELRAGVPAPILAHYDRLVARGKKGVAVVRNQVCTGCHMRLPIGTINTLLQRQDVQLCDSCGRYLYIPEEIEAAAEPAPVAPVKPVAKRKRKALAGASA
jgi:predicted  nucleic acid-binding Zn-ribbon protein